MPYSGVMAIVTAQVEIRGRKALIWNCFGPDALPLGKKARSGVAGNDPDEWRKTVLATPEGQLYLRPSYIFGSLRNGAARTKQGRGTLQSAVTATLEVLDGRVLIDRWLPKKGFEGLKQAETAPVYLDIRPVRNPATKARNVRYRVAASPGWESAFTISWDNTVVGENEMNAVVKDAGQFAGLGDGRNIGFGRFEVRSFKILENKKHDAKKPAAKRAVARASKKGMES
jgi:hypothetical protein